MTREHWEPMNFGSWDEWFRWNFGTSTRRTQDLYTITEIPVPEKKILSPRTEMSVPDKRILIYQIKMQFQQTRDHRNYEA